MRWFDVIKEEVSFADFIDDSPKMNDYYEENFANYLAGSSNGTVEASKVLLNYWWIRDEWEDRTDIGNIIYNIVYDIIVEDNVHVISKDPDELFHTKLFTLQQWESHIPKFENKTNELRRLVAIRELNSGSENLRQLVD